MLIRTQKTKNPSLIKSSFKKCCTFYESRAQAGMQLMLGHNDTFQSKWSRNQKLKKLTFSFKSDVELNIAIVCKQDFERVLDVASL